jgi:hypothetical protein
MSDERNRIPYHLLLMELRRQSTKDTLLHIQENIFYPPLPLSAKSPLSFNPGTIFFSSFLLHQSIIHLCPSSSCSCLEIVKREDFYPLLFQQQSFSSSLLTSFFAFPSFITRSHIASLLTSLLTIERLAGLPFSNIIMGKKDLPFTKRIFFEQTSSSDILLLTSPPSIPGVALLSCSPLPKLFHDFPTISPSYITPIKDMSHKFIPLLQSLPFFSIPLQISPLIFTCSIFTSLLDRLPPVIMVEDLLPFS